MTDNGPREHRTTRQYIGTRTGAEPAACWTEDVRYSREPGVPNAHRTGRASGGGTGADALREDDPACASNADGVALLASDRFIAIVSSLRQNVAAHREQS